MKLFVCIFLCRMWQFWSCSYRMLLEFLIEGMDTFEALCLYFLLIFVVGFDFNKFIVIV